MNTTWPVNFTLTFERSGTLEIFGNNIFRIGPNCTEELPVKLKLGARYRWRVIKNYPLLLVEFAKGAEPYNCYCSDHYKYNDTNNECQDDETEKEEGEKLCFWFNFYDSRDRDCHQAWLDSSGPFLLRTNLKHHELNDSKSILKLK